MNEILGITLGSVTIGGIIIFLGKIIINRGFDVAVKNFENKLELLRIEHQIRFSKLHEERANLLKELYHKLYELIQALKFLTTSFQGEKWTDDTEKLDSATSKLKDCINLFEKNRIFFPNDFCVKMEDSLEESKKAIEDWRKTVTKGKREEHANKWKLTVPYKDGDTALDWWLKTEQKVNIELEERRKKLAVDFRELLE